jgi:hypothetical protein
MENFAAGGGIGNGRAQTRGAGRGRGRQQPANRTVTPSKRQKMDAITINVPLPEALMRRDPPPPPPQQLPQIMPYQQSAQAAAPVAAAPVAAAPAVVKSPMAVSDASTPAKDARLTMFAKEVNLIADVIRSLKFSSDQDTGVNGGMTDEAEKEFEKELHLLRSTQKLLCDRILKADTGKFTKECQMIHQQVVSLLEKKESHDVIRRVIGITRYDHVMKEEFRELYVESREDQSKWITGLQDRIAEFRAQIVEIRDRLCLSKSFERKFTPLQVKFEDLTREIVNGLKTDEEMRLWEVLALDLSFSLKLKQLGPLNRTVLAYQMINDVINDVGDFNRREADYDADQHDAPVLVVQPPPIVVAPVVVEVQRVFLAHSVSQFFRSAFATWQYIREEAYALHLELSTLFRFYYVVVYGILLFLFGGKIFSFLSWLCSVAFKFFL